MRQYYGNGRIIVRRFLIIVVSIAAIGMGHANDKIIDVEWYHNAATEAFERRGLPPVEVTGSSIHNGVLQTEIAPRDWIENAQLNFVLAAPAGRVTTATMTVDELSESTGTAGQRLEYQREIDVSVESLGYVRGNHLVKVEVPAIVPGTAGRRLRKGTLKIYFEAANKITAERKANDPDLFARMLAKIVANPADIDGFAIPLDSVPSPSDAAGVPPLGRIENPVASFKVSKEGFVSFTGADLAAIGVHLADTVTTSVSVWSEGEQQAVLLLGLFDGTSGTIQLDDKFLVFTRESKSTYTKERVYWVKISDDAPLLPDLVLSAPAPEEARSNKSFMATQTVETDTTPVLTKNDQFLTILGYRWAWWTWTGDKKSANVPAPRDYQTSGSFGFDVPGLVHGRNPAKMKLHFYIHRWPVDAQPVSFQIMLNGTAVGNVTVSDPDGVDHALEVPTVLLRESGNELVLQPQASGRTVFPDIAFDRMELDYPRSYKMTTSSLDFLPPSSQGGVVGINVSDSGSPQVLIADISKQKPKLIIGKGGPVKGVRYLRTEGPADRRYVASDLSAIPGVDLQQYRPQRDLRSSNNRADVIVIAWHDFTADMQPWVEFRRSQGHAVEVVDVQDIYDQFGYGELSPHAIRAFLRYAAEHWQGSKLAPAASYVLLIGDSTSAYRNEFRNDVINYVPTMRVTATDDPFASDQWFVSMFGDDSFSDAMIGRFSVNNRDDLRNVIRKQLEYTAQETTAPWQNRLGFIADHTEFDETLDRVMTRAVPPWFEKTSVSMSDLPWIDNYYFPKELASVRRAKVSPQATLQIRDMFNEGAAVVTYFGHGSPNIWSNERMWFGGDSPNSDNHLLTNRDRLPIVINMTCNSGAIDYPQPNWNIAISEDFMRVPNGGAVACFVPSGPGLTLQHERLMNEISLELFGKESQPLGQSLQLALWRYLAEGNPRHLAEMFILLGDPMLVPKINTVQSSETLAGNIKDLQVTQWSRLDKPAADTATAALELELQNTSPYPTREVAVSITDPEGRQMAEAEAVDILPFSSRRILVDVPIQTGLNNFRGWLSAGAEKVELHPAVPFAAAGLRPDDQRDNVPPAAIDPRTVEVTYREADGKVIANVSAQVYALAREPLSNLRLGLQGNDGIVDRESVVTIPATSPGMASRVTLPMEMASAVASEQFKIRFDPSGFYPEFHRFPPLTVSMGPQQFPDLSLVSASASTTAPTEGETVFFDVTVANTGESDIDGVRPAGYIVDAAGRRTAMPTQVLRKVQPQTLESGSSSTFRLRWDPVDNIGSSTLAFAVRSIYGAPDRSPADNETTLTLRARTKADIRNLKVEVLPISVEDRQMKQIRIAAHVRNAGETEAHGLRVTYYGSPEKKESDLLGSVDIEAINPGQTVQAVLTYRMKPGEERRPFRFTTEVMYKGSRQRIPLER